jgi:hypothetical protein
MSSMFAACAATSVRASFDEAVKAWKSPDDETCEDCVPCCEKGID